jgi:amino acid transporter
MAETDRALMASIGQNELAHGSLRLWDAIAISVSVLAPGMAMLLNTSGVAAEAGGSTPLAFLLGGVACLALAFVVIGFTRRMASAGYAYTYASRSLGKTTGFVTGWLYFFGMICFVPMTMSGAAYLATDLLGIGVGWWIAFFFIGMALFVVLSVIRIKVTTRTQLIVGIATVAIIVLVDLITTAKGGVHGQSAGAFTFNHTIAGGFNGVFYGIIFGVTSYIGFETSADFGEETANPRRFIPIAVIVATLFAVIFYLWTTYSMAIGFGVKNGATWASDPTALQTIANSFIGSWLGTLVVIGGMCSAFIVCVACATAGTRTLFAMGREGVLPRVLGRTHPRWQTPVNATVAVAVVAIVMALLIGYPFADSIFGPTYHPFSNYYFWATVGTLAIIVVYILLCLGGIVFFARTRASRRWNPLVHVLVPVIGAVVFGAALYGSVHPAPPGILRWTPYVALVWLAAGIAVVAWLRARRPEAVERIGSILGEEGGTGANVLDAVADPGPGGSGA